MASSKEIPRAVATQAQLDFYDHPEDDRGYGIGPMQEALMRFRCRKAVEYFGEAKLPILDLGCGQGKATKVLASAGVFVVGIDIAINRLRDTASKNPTGEFAYAFVQELPFADNAIGGVCAFEIFEHLIPGDSLAMLAEIKRVLVPGGKIILSTPNTASLAARARRFFSDGRRPSRQDHFNEVSYRQLRAIFAEAGFTVTELSGLGLVPGMWRVQSLFPSSVMQDINLVAGYRFPELATETFLVATKP